MNLRRPALSCGSAASGKQVSPGDLQAGRGGDKGRSSAEAALLLLSRKGQRRTAHTGAMANVPENWKEAHSINPLEKK